MARGNARQAVFRDTRDREAFLEGLKRICERFDWRVWSYCLMDNHYHLMVETLEPTLSRGMREMAGFFVSATVICLFFFRSVIFIYFLRFR